MATTPTGEAAVRAPRDVIAGARRRRRKRILTALLFGVIVWGFTLGALGERAPEEVRRELLPPDIAALALGVAAAIGSLPVAWSVIGRIIIPVPTFFLYLTIFVEKEPPLPFYAAFALALCYAAALTGLSRYLADRPGRSVLGSRGAISHEGEKGPGRS
jgi:hypothetical protein